MLRDELTAPEGWEWASHGRNILGMVNIPLEIPLVGENSDYYFNTLRAFFTFLEENDLKAVGFDRATFNFTGLDHPYRIAEYCSFDVFSDEEWPYGDEDMFLDKPFICDCGSEEFSHSSIICHSCDKLFYCTSCRLHRNSGAFYDSISSTTHCEYCGTACTTCDRYHSGYTIQCEECAPRFSCVHCGSWSNDEPLPINSIAITTIYNGSGRAALFCESCRSLFCESCDAFGRNPVNEVTHLCSRCELIGPEGDSEIHDDDSDLESGSFQLPSIPGREMIRLCGVEIEGGLGKERETIHSTGDRLSGPNSLARALYDKQLSLSYMQESYHHGAGFARVETDSSCDWECVIGPINMADIVQVEKLNNVVRTIKEHIKSDLLKLDLRCGTHVHVGAERVSLGQAYNLHLIYTYMEDVLYRLGASHWPVHRMLVQGEDSHGAQKSPKMTEKVKFARTFHGNRYYGLSFNNYFERMFDLCRCGAVQYGVFEDCTCDLGKCTFEFRLFNTTANTIKLHAYIALCQALVAKAISMPEVKDSSTFEELPFLVKRYKDMEGDIQTEMLGAWEERLRYIASDLPLTVEEKKSILYCINNSELSKVSDSVKKLYKGDSETKMKKTITEKVGV